MTSLWVVLQQNKKNEYLGPYSTSELKKLVINKVVTYKDYLWKEGFSVWQPIKDIQPFNQYIEKPISFELNNLRNHAPITPAKTQWSHILTQKVYAESEESLPHEAEGQSLV